MPVQQWTVTQRGHRVKHFEVQDLAVREAIDMVTPDHPVRINFPDGSVIALYRSCPSSERIARDSRR